MNIFDELKARGLVFQTTDEAALSKALTEDMVSYYVDMTLPLIPFI